MDAVRIKRVRAAMKKAKLAALFVTNPKNVKYLTGFQTMMPGEVQSFGDPEGFALIVKGAIHFLCDGRYIDGAKQLEGVKAQLLTSPVTAKTIADKIKSLLPKGTRTLGYETDAILHVDAVGLNKHMKGVNLKPCQDLFAELRLIKTPEEVKLLKKAQDITCDCFDYIRKTIKLGMSERDVAMAIDGYLKSHSEGCSFDSIVAFGETACHPHYVPDPKRKLKKNQMVLLDFGSIHKGYCGDMTRMLFVGKAPERYKEVYKIVLEAQEACLKTIKPGATCHDCDMAVRHVFKKYKCEDRFLHGTGHGVGLAIHEDPRIKQGFKDKLRPGMVFTDEPGLYYPGWGGIRIEDMIVVTERGSKNLTRTPKQLIEIKL